MFPKFKIYFKYMYQNTINKRYAMCSENFTIECISFFKDNFKFRQSLSYSLIFLGNFEMCGWRRKLEMPFTVLRYAIGSGGEILSYKNSEICMPHLTPDPLWWRSICFINFRKISLFWFHFEFWNILLFLCSVLKILKVFYYFHGSFF